MFIPIWALGVIITVSVVYGGAVVLAIFLFTVEPPH